MHFVVILVHDKTHKVVDSLLHTIREREEDQFELFAESCEASVGWLPQNGVEYVESCCKQRLDSFRIHGGEIGRVVGVKVDAITQGRGLSQDHGA